MKKLDTVIIGGGLAGLSCAVDLVAAGQTVLILEADNRLGGRTSSWTDKGLHIDSGLHRVMGFYQHLPELLRKVGVPLDSIVMWNDEMEIRLPELAPAVLGTSFLHRPIMTLYGALGNNHVIPPSDKVAVSTFMSAGLKMVRSDPVALDQLTITQLARDHNVSEQTIDHWLATWTQEVFFLRPDEMSAYPLFRLIEFALARPLSVRMGSFAGGMSEVMINPIVSHLQLAGAEIITGTRVTGIKPLDHGYEISTEWSNISTDHIVVATAIGTTKQLLRPLVGKHPWFQPFFALPMQSSLSLQVELPQPALKFDRIVYTPGTSVACLAEQSRTTFRSSTGRLSMIMADPQKRLKLSAENLLKAARADLAPLGIDLRRVGEYRRVAHVNEIYKPAPGAEALRPPQRTPLPGLFLAGDYTQQPWSATIEGAVLSGQLAASEVLGDAAPATATKPKRKRTHPAAK